MDVSPGTPPGQCESGEHSWYWLTAVPVTPDAEQLKDKRPLRKLPAERAVQQIRSRHTAKCLKVLGPPGPQGCVPHSLAMLDWKPL